MTDAPETNDAAETTDAPAEEAQPGRSTNKLGFGIGTLFVLAAVLLFLAFISIWANRQIFNSEQWTETSTEVISQPEVQDVLANYLVDQLFSNVNVEQELQKQLPPDLDALASPAAGALRTLALNGTKKALALPVVQSAWSGANKIAHQTLITTLEGGGKGNVSTANGEVTIDARTILTEVATKVGVGEKLVSKVPADAGTFVIWKSDNLAAAQDAYKLFKDFLWVFTLLAIALYVLAIALAKGRRRRAVMWMGGSFVVVSLLVLITVSLARTPAINSLAQTAAVEPAVADVYDIATELLKSMADSLLFTGVMVLLAGIVAGPYRWAVEARRFVAPYLRDYLPFAAALVVLLYLILIWWAPVAGFRTTVGLTLNTVLAIAGFIALARITRHEFPDAEEADFGAVGAWVSGRWGDASQFVRERTQKEAEVPSVRPGEKTTVVRTTAPEDQPTEPLPSAAGKVDELERLQKLHADGALTDAEFEAAKKQLLG